MSKLLDMIRTTSGRARQTGHLVSLPTTVHRVDDGDFRFLVRVLGNLERKKEAKKKDPNFNPFLPYEKEMFVSLAPPRHVFILNKFNVVDNHLLIITEEFEEQSSLLTKSDFYAMWLALKDLDGLAFYNAGTIAGASQRHKHLQVIPTPMDSEISERTPFDAAIRAVLHGAAPGNIEMSPQFPFIHSLVSLSDCESVSEEESARLTFERYINCIAKLSEELTAQASVTSNFSYNLLATREWLFLVPRSEECCQGISLNSLAFAGALLVPREELLELVRKVSIAALISSLAWVVDRLSTSLRDVVRTQHFLLYDVDLAFKFTPLRLAPLAVHEIPL